MEKDHAIAKEPYTICKEPCTIYKETYAICKETNTIVSKDATPQNECMQLKMSSIPTAKKVYTETYTKRPMQCAKRPVQNLQRDLYKETYAMCKETSTKFTKRPIQRDLCNVQRDQYKFYKETYTKRPMQCAKRPETYAM